MKIFREIRNWASDRGLYEKGDVKTQYCKLGEEFGELGRAIIKDDQALLVDSIGDCVVVLTNLAHLAGTSIEECTQAAYNEIKDRKGSMKNNSFVKDERKDDGGGYPRIYFTVSGNFLSCGIDKHDIIKAAKNHTVFYEESSKYVIKFKVADIKRSKKGKGSGCFIKKSDVELVSYEKFQFAKRWEGLKLISKHGDSRAWYDHDKLFSIYDKIRVKKSSDPRKTKGYISRDKSYPVSDKYKSADKLLELVHGVDLFTNETSGKI